METPSQIHGVIFASSPDSHILSGFVFKTCPESKLFSSQGLSYYHLSLDPPNSLLLGLLASALVLSGIFKPMSYLCSKPYNGFMALQIKAHVFVFDLCPHSLRSRVYEAGAILFYSLLKTSTHDTAWHRMDIQ
jgi:hypothetical protein